MNVAVFWFRRDLRFEDNTALIKALEGSHPVLPLFIFDSNILSELARNDARVSFIYHRISGLNDQLKKYESSISVLKGNPLDIWKSLIQEQTITDVYFNKDYEPYAIQRDLTITNLLEDKGIEVHTYKDQVIYEEGEIVKDNKEPYTVFTPYKNKWLNQFRQKKMDTNCFEYVNFYKMKKPFPVLKDLGFKSSDIVIKDFDLTNLDNYERSRNFPSLNTSLLSPHLRFGTVSIRQIIAKLKPEHTVFLSELIWREFFMQIIYHFPQVVTKNFKSQYDGIEWRNNKEEFELWCMGKTGYPLVDAGMRQLNKTGYMHNRVRMVTAGFLCKHLLIDWRWGEAYFAEKLLDYELSSNNGNWQWAAGTGCDAAPYFRIFNPSEQVKKFDRDYKYIRQWIPELDSFTYPQPIVEHKIARQRAIETFKKGLALHKQV